AGKSTLIRAVSSARPKVADYPFTTLHPSLGVVSVSASRSFVMADVPGLIEGAADGAGLGIRFLKHLSRTRLLLHLVDMGPQGDPVNDVKTIMNELARFSPELAQRERWLILNKVDLLPAAEREQICDELVRALDWQGPVFSISALAGEGTDTLVQAVMAALDNLCAIADVMQARAVGASLSFDLAELRAYNYQTGMSFAVFVPGRGQEIARGGRYDDIGRVFGRARPATGFSTDLKTLMDLSQRDFGARAAAILAPAGDAPELLAAIRELRSRGERVIISLPGQQGDAADMGCDRQLVEDNGNWTVKPV
ncbi:MAG: ATP phosphoribosyltransferase regulatory subunit, partial [Thiohalobacterales bacterium]|nr:ATP phosphoribosyltransferase regulatory subunit [Thiohalobacterales bacterium]